MKQTYSWSDASSLEERSALWAARHSLWFAFVAMFGKIDESLKVKID